MASSKFLKTRPTYRAFASKFSNVGIFGIYKFPRLFFDLTVLSLKITLATLIATFRIIVPPAMKNLSGETVLITGAGHGIGRELAIQLSALGCNVVCWDNDKEANKSTMNAVLKIGGQVYGFVVDVSKRFEVRETVRLMRKVGVPEVTVLINNAAVLVHRPLLAHDSDNIERIFGVNVMSNFWTIEAFLPRMLLNNKGHIVCMSSMCGIYGVPLKVPYCSSKFAIRGLMEGLHEELRMDPKKPKINCTTIYPFWIDTGLDKDPKYRFPQIFGVVTPQYAAQEVIKAVRRNYTEYSIPKCLLFLNSINRIVPEKVMRLTLDFLADGDKNQKENNAIKDHQMKCT
ncbi:short-chain dehydrogenase/reductase family 16C member 6 [Orussus abietinus]|uniref:short-chain dehydrogenase/reductase family 16C member 6 n=1 Tax=Orussus abietinus TaxID=222816 RepID=UPI000625AE87|nr:short-chain dehydrogenase/reductase family 16C member 6 [Orussus abietinus]